MDVRGGQGRWVEAEGVQSRRQVGTAPMTAEQQRGAEAGRAGPEAGLLHLNGNDPSVRSPWRVGTPQQSGQRTGIWGKVVMRRGSGLGRRRGDIDLGVWA